MKKLNLLFGLLLISSSCLAAKTIDECLYKFTYHTEIRTTEENKQPNIESYVLEVGREHTKFYPPRFEESVLLKDSILRVGMNPDDVLNLMLSRNLFDVRQSMRIISNYPEAGQLTDVENMGDDYMASEAVPKLKWKFLPGDSVIAGHKCAKAQTSFRGRTWNVWFASDIPIHSGPWKLSGLPGLILYASDSDGLFLFDCKGIEKGMSSPMEVITKQTYRKCSVKDLIELRKQWLSNSFGMMIQAVGLAGENIDRPKKKTPYSLEILTE